MKRNKVKLVALLFIVGITFSPAVRHLTANTLHTLADIISPEGN